MNHCGSKWDRNGESGQAALIIVVFLGMFLLGILGLATDYTQVWAHRQMAQGAADAACQAGAADLFLNYENPSASAAYTLDYSWIGSDFNCAAHPGASPCWYAEKNGYSGSNVNVSFPASVEGVSLSGFGTVATPFIQVTITDPVSLSFAKLLTTAGTVNVKASAICGMNPVKVPVPLVVLHPTDPESLHVNGNPDVQIWGGPNRSVQVDSSNSSAVTPGGGSWNIDLTHAGPAGTGADFGVFGKESRPANIDTGTGKWISPATPYGDPWITIDAPEPPGTSGTATPVPLGWNGCPDPAGCVEFTAGDYSTCSTLNNLPPGANGCLMLPYSGSNPRFAVPMYPNWQSSHSYTAGDWIIPTSNNPGDYVYRAMNTGVSAGAGPAAWNQTWLGNQSDGGVTWMNIGKVTRSPETAIFDPGLYYVGAHGLELGSHATARMSTAAGDDTNGVTFYFSTSDTVSVGSNAGDKQSCTSASPSSSSPTNCIVPYQLDGNTLLGVASRPLRCPDGPANPPEVYLKADGSNNGGNIKGNILLGPCSGTYGSSDGENRGFLFFQNRGTAATATWGGGGQFLISGFMYFHNTSYGSTLSLSGNSGAGAFTLGNIVADKVTLGGTSGIKMLLNPAETFDVLRPQLLK